MYLSPMPQFAIPNANVNITVLGGVSWNVGQGNGGICEIGQVFFFQIDLFCGFYRKIAAHFKH